MRLLIPSAVTAPDLAPLLRRRPYPLLPVLGKPMLAYQLDLASSLGVTHVTVVAADRPEEVRAFAAGGQPWGLEVEVVAVLVGVPLEQQIARFAPAGEELLLLAPDALVAPVAGDRSVRPVVREGWADGSGWVLAYRPAGGEVGVGWVAGASARRQVTAYRVGSLRGFADAHRVLLQDPGHLVVPGFEVAPGILVSRGSKVSLAAVAQPPVLIGEYARVSFRAAIGPGVTVGPRSMVDDEATLADTVVMPRTYVGRLLAARGLVLDGQLILNPETGSAAAIGDDLLLADLSRSLFGEKLRQWWERAIGALLLVPAAPLLALAALVSPVPRWQRRRVLSHRVRLGVDGSPQRLAATVRELATASFPLRRLSWLLEVAAGRMALRGNPPIAADDAERLAPVLIERWLSVPAGMVGTAQSEEARRGSLDLDDAAAAASVEAAGTEPRSTAALLLRAFLECLRPAAWRRPAPSR